MAPLPREDNQEECREHIRQHQPLIIVLLETPISGTLADKVCRKSGYDRWYRIETQGFQGAVYASPHSHKREGLWTNIQEFGAMPWLLVGDFNKTISLDERNHGKSEMVRHCIRFKHWIENNEFIDLGFSGLKFTWIKGNTLETQKCARLDRALCNAVEMIRDGDHNTRYFHTSTIILEDSITSRNCKTMMALGWWSQIKLVKWLELFSKACLLRINIKA
ncbi:LOW QUALITY PROTEIN: hypothetical protein Cgig2_002031 [Carnegiea gigantea]|uniref:Endonuclease/exonuclease/phosphatase domain-containing protein n=1 Tax=Carnegiea gigantea TaxID=171969 RepID=A0A9Q1GJ91_9CARY|nr:LOW QUALITY PROTEIN: hypothetical protein Cgig2_002031 [Carnegiea gigantea]